MFRKRTGLLWAERASGSFWIWAKITSPVKYGIRIPAFAGMTIGGANRVKGIRELEIRVSEYQEISV